MKQAVFITGFNNWGKTKIINTLFNRQKFYHGWYYRIPSVNANFTVESHSNDDNWGQDWADKVQERIDNEVHKDLNLFTALCPTLHADNIFIDLLSNLPFANYQKLNVILVEYKFEHHAKLLINNITSAGKGIPNINFIVINADQAITNDQLRFEAKMNQIIQELRRIFP